MAMAAPAMPADIVTMDPALADDYRRALLAHIWAYRRPLAQGLGLHGVRAVSLRILLTRDGAVQWVDVATSSGESGLDDEAVATIWRALPMPPIPAALPDRLVVTLPVAPSMRLPG